MEKKKSGCGGCLIFFIAFAVLGIALTVYTGFKAESEDYSNYIDRIEILAIEDGAVYYGVYFDSDVNWDNLADSYMYHLAKYSIEECKLLFEKEDLNHISVDGIDIDGKYCFFWNDGFMNSHSVDVISLHKNFKSYKTIDFESGNEVIFEYKMPALEYQYSEDSWGQ